MTILLLPHGNADPERGFSINKRLLEVVFVFFQISSIIFWWELH